MAEHTYNRLFTEEKWDLVNKENKLIMDDFLEEYRSQRKKESTLKQYFYDIRFILIYILDNCGNKVITELNKKDFRRLVLWGTDNKMSSARVNRLKSSVGSLLEYCENEDDYDYEINQMKKIKGLQRERVTETTFLTDEQIHEISEKLLENEDYLSNALLWFAYDTGARVNEIAQIKIPKDKSQVLMNEVIAKRGKKYKPILLDKSKEAVWLYIEKGRVETNSENLWVGKIENELDVKAIYYRFKKMGEILTAIEGEEYELNPHDARHWFIENMKNGTHYMCKKIGKLSLEQIQKIVRHSDIGTTQSYTRDTTDDDVMEALQINI